MIILAHGRRLWVSGTLIFRQVPALWLGVLALVVYTATLSPGVYGFDSAELSTGAYTLGIVHPPGYPLYLLIAHLFVQLPIGDVAYRVNLMSAVFGAGPIFLIRCEPFHVRWFAVSLDLLGGLVIYSDRFPPGGDIYNFTWRMGGALLFRLGPRLTLSVGARWMHVSNGQGLNPGNPSYEGVGVPLGLTYRL